MTDKVNRAATELKRSKIRDKRVGVKVQTRQATWKGKIKHTLASVFLSNINRIYNKNWWDRSTAYHKSTEKLLYPSADWDIAEQEILPINVVYKIWSWFHIDAQDNRGGTLIHINDNWTSSYKILSTQFDSDSEWLSRCDNSGCQETLLVSSWSYNSDAVASIHQSIEETKLQNPDAAIITLGDFNSASIKLKKIQAACPRPHSNNKILGKCYTHEKFSLKDYKLPVLGASDHSSVLILPKDHKQFTTHQFKFIKKKIWSGDNISKLLNCLDATD